MIFISYKSEEEQLMLSVRKQLTDCGYKCWSANPDILGGGNYLEAIPEAMETANAFLLLLSEKSQQSKWVLKEVSQACTYDKPLFALNIDGCIPNKSIAFAYQINQIISGKDRMQDAVQDLIRALYAHGILPQSGDNAVQKIEIKAKEASKKPDPEKGKIFYDSLPEINTLPQNEAKSKPTIHSLPRVEVKDGKPVNVDPNWLIIEEVTYYNLEYYKLAEIGKIDEYHLDSLGDTLKCYSSKNDSTFSKDVPINSFYIDSWQLSAFAMANQFLKDVVHSSYKYLNRSQRLLARTINGMKSYFVFSERKKRFGREYRQDAVLYVQSHIADWCIQIHTFNIGTSPDCFGNIDEIRDLFYTVAKSIKMEI